MAKFQQQKTETQGIESLLSGIQALQIGNSDSEILPKIEKRKSDVSINCEYLYTEGNIDSYVNSFVKFSLGGFKEGCQFLLKDMMGPDHDKFYVVYSGAIDSAEYGANLDFFLDKRKQQAPDQGSRDDRKDIFDELMPVMLEEKTCKVKIIFPYNVTNFHWLTGEIVLLKEGNNISVEITTHNPYGGGSLLKPNAELILSALTDRMGENGLTILHTNNMNSPFELPRQDSYDTTSCGAIVADEITKRMQGIDLQNTYPIGAEDLRLSQLEYLEEKLGQADRVFQLFRKDIIDPSRWDANPYTGDEKPKIDKIDSLSKGSQPRSGYANDESGLPSDGKDNENWSRAIRIQSEIDNGKDIIHKFVDQDHAEEATIIIGRTGSGKSTLANYLVMPKDTIVEKDECDLVKISGGGAEVGDGTVSKTTFPNKIGKYWDCPGFDDTGGEGQDIVNAFFIKEVFTLPKAVKLMLVIQWTDLTGNVGTVKNLMKTLGTLFENINDIIPSLSVFITKVPQDKIHLVNPNINRLLKGLDGQKDLYAKKILESCLSQSESVPLIVFPEIKPGDFPQPILDLMGSNEGMLSILEERKYVQISKVNLSVAPTSQVFINKMALKLSDDIYRDTATLMEKYKGFISDLCSIKKGLPELDNLLPFMEKVKQYQSKVGILVRKLNELQSDGGIDSLKLMKEALKVVKENQEMFSFSVTKECEKLVSLVEQFEFFVQIEPDSVKAFNYDLVKPIFTQTEIAIKNKIDWFVGRLKGQIYEKSQSILKEFANQVNEHVQKQVKKASESSNLKDMEACKDFMQKIGNLLTTFAFESPGSKIDKLSEIVKQLNLASLTKKFEDLNVYRNLVDLFPEYFDRTKYYEDLNNVMRPIGSLSDSYHEAQQGQQKVWHDRFNQIFDSLFKQIEELTKVDLVRTAKLAKNVESIYTTFSDDAQRDLGSVLPAVIEIINDDTLLTAFTSAQSIVEKIENLNKIGLRIDNVKEAVLRQAVGEVKVLIKESFVKLYQEKVEDIAKKVSDIVKENCVSLSDLQQQSLEELLINWKGGIGDLLAEFQKGVLSSWIVSLYLGSTIKEAKDLELLTKSLSIDEVSTLQRKEFSNVSSKIDDLYQYIISDPAGRILQNFTLKVLEKLEALHTYGQSITDIKQNLREFLEHLNTQLVGDQVTIEGIIEKAPKFLRFDDLPDEINQFLSIPFSMDKVASSINKIKGEVAILDHWYNSIGLVHDIIMKFGYSFYKEYPVINDQNFARFFNTLSEKDGNLGKDFEFLGYHKVISNHLNSLLDHSWRSGREVKFKTNKESGEVVFTGQCIVLSKLLESVDDSAKSIKVYAQGTVVLDTDITKHGVNFTIFAPYWDILKPLTIDLSGLDAKNYASGQNSAMGYSMIDGRGNSGPNGLNGQRGGDSGSFYAAGYKFTKLPDQIHFNLTGGKGGDGQRGGDGATGYSGNASSLADFYNDHNCFRLDAEWSHRFDFGKMYNRIELVKGQDGSQGGNGGAGGLAGRGGNGGYACIYDLEHGGATPWSLAGAKGKDGKFGDCGTVGQGGYFGNNLKVWYYQNQWGSYIRYYEQHNSGYQYKSHNGSTINTYVKAADGIAKFKKGYYLPETKQKTGFDPQLLQDFSREIELPGSNIYDILERSVLDDFMEVSSRVMGDSSTFI